MTNAAKVVERPERIVGDYVLGRRLGSGATGEVWLSFHCATNAPAAVKLLLEREHLWGPSKRLLERESRAIARLNHPNIVAVYDSGPNYLVMAYIEGQTLAQRLNTPVRPADAIDWALQLASALAHAHSRSVVHRDVKPGNVMLDSGGSVYLGDFGLAVLVDEGDPNLHGGTPGYMAPEQQTRQIVGPAADQYGLARTLLEMLASGNLPADREAALATMPTSLPDALTDILRRALAHDPAQRWPTVAAFAEELTKVDLTDHAAPVRLAPERRVRAPFAWCTSPSHMESLAADIQRADFRLSTLEKQGNLAGGTVERFREATGYADFGWSMYAHTSRLGPVGHSSVMARASDLIVLLHGTMCDRGVWPLVATALCRHNAQAIVFVPDVLGFGQSPFGAMRDVDDARFAPRALVDAITTWLDLLSLCDIPTVIAGHSIAALSLLSVTDDELGEQVCRVALTPIFPSAHPSIRRTLKLGSLLIKTLGHVEVMRRVLGRLMFRHGPATKSYSPADRDELHRQFMSVPADVLSRIYAGHANALPPPQDRLERCAVLIGKDDPVAPTEMVLDTLRELHFPERNIHHLASGGHLPQGTDEDHPGWTMRNAHDIARIIESMLLSSREGTPHPTAMESTIMATDERT